jgi:Flp pilus assembly protein TadD
MLRGTGMRPHGRNSLTLVAGLLLTALTGCGDGGLSGLSLDMGLSEDTSQQQQGTAEGAVSASGNAQADALVKLADDIVAQGKKKDTALPLYEKAAAASNNAPPVLLKLAEAYMRAGQKAQGINTYRMAVDQEAASPEVLLAGGTALVKAGVPALGAGALQRAAVALNSFSAHNRLGVAHMMMGEFKQAKGALQSAYALAPDDVDIATNLALVMALSGEYDGAAALMQKAVEGGRAQPSHWRNYVLILAIAGQQDNARTTAGGRVTDAEIRGLIKRADSIRSMSDPKAQVRALGLVRS